MGITFYTLDVGHGLCQVIRFGDRAILIDGGGKLGKPVAEDFLKRYIRVIVAYVATHNDSDHVGAAPELLDYYSSSATLNHIWLLMDRPTSARKKTPDDVIPLLAYATRRKQQGTIIERHALYASDIGDQSTTIHPEPSEHAELQVLYPKPLDTSEALIRDKADAVATNQISAILRLVVGNRKDRAAILITGDANCQSFRIAHDDYKRTLSAKVLTVPHHGGEIPTPQGAPSWDTVVNWIKPEIAVVSAGFGNVPRTTVTKRKSFEPMRQLGIRTCCTQITKHCHAHLSTLSPSVIPVSNRPLPQMSGRKGFESAVACAGTIVIKISGKGDVSMPALESHQVAVDQMVVSSGGTPHCR